MIIMETMFILQGILLVILLIIIIILFRNVLGDKKAARIKYYSLEPIKREELSFSDKFVSGYISLLVDLGKLLRRVIILLREVRSMKDILNIKIEIEYRLLILLLISLLYR